MSKNIVDFYNRFSYLYPLVDIFLKPQKRKLFNLINELPNGQLLEIGVGSGSHLKLYKTHKVIGIDISNEMLEKAKKEKIENVELKQMDAQSLQFEKESFDYIVLSHVIAVVDMPEKLLEECYRVLKTNGKIFILNHFTPNNFLGYLDYSFHFISKYFCFKSVFNIESLNAIKNFKLVKEIIMDKYSYFKILIYSK